MAVSLKTFRSLVIYFPLGLFVMSLPLVAFTYQGTDGLESPPGYILLLIGPMLIAGGAALEWLTWLANPVAAAALYFFIAATRSARLKMSAHAQRNVVSGFRCLPCLSCCLSGSGRLSFATKPEPRGRYYRSTLVITCGRVRLLCFVWVFICIS